MLFLFAPIVALLLATAPALAQNATSLQGTWASGAGNVMTGWGFANPANMTFIYPNTTGVSYSFTDTGYFERAWYRFTSNGTQPQCITGLMVWTHGTYTLEANGSMVLVPFGDGYQQIEDPCGAVSNLVQSYNVTELYVSWTIFLDSVLGYQLQMYQYDGTALPQQNLISTTPNMLPTEPLRNSTGTVTITGLQSALKVGAGERIRPGLAVAACTLIALAMASVLL